MAQTEIQVFLWNW